TATAGTRIAIAASPPTKKCHASPTTWWRTSAPSAICRSKSTDPTRATNVFHASGRAFSTTSASGANAAIVWPATANGVNDWITIHPDARAAVTSDAITHARVVRDRARCHTTTGPRPAPAIVCAVKVAEAIAGPPTGARNSAVAAAPESIDNVQAITIQ